MFGEKIPLHMNHDGVPQCTNPQWNIMKQFSRIITSIAEPWWTTDSIECRWEQLNIFNLKGTYNTEPSMEMSNTTWNYIFSQIC